VPVIAGTRSILDRRGAVPGRSRRRLLQAQEHAYCAQWKAISRRLDWPGESCFGLAGESSSLVAWGAVDWCWRQVC
jgi:hypothetical protein